MTAYWHLLRPRIVALVLAAMLVSAYTATENSPDLRTLVHALLGTLGVIVGAIAFNQRIELHSDAKMPRTADRPLPSGRLAPRQVTIFAVLATVFGLVYLAAFGTWLLTGMAFLSWIFYVAAYTPMKRRSVWQTPIGSVAGAMPVLLGAAAVGAPWSRPAWCLFGIMFFWQFPHSMAIAWLYRREFSDAEVRVATVVDATGRMAGALAIFGAAMLLPIGLLPNFLSLVRWEYGPIAALLGLVYLHLSFRFRRLPCNASARRLLGMSLLYLPILLAAFLVFRG
jgi:protoheme IX farnesyltransferase